MKLSSIGVLASMMLVVFCLSFNPAAELLIADQIPSLDLTATPENENFQNRDFVIESDHSLPAENQPQPVIWVQKLHSVKFYSPRFTDIRGSPYPFS